MRLEHLVPAACSVVVLLAATPAVAVKTGPYPEIKVDIVERIKPEPAFEAMRKAFADAATTKNAAALFPLVGPTFVWTVEGGPTDQFDMGRDALHNFKVLFGFRGAGKDQDGGVENGPFWESLQAFGAQADYYAPPDAGNLVCGPLLANVKDAAVFDRARQKIETEDDKADWYFTMGDTSVTKAPGDAGPPVAKIGAIAVPVLDVAPTAPEGSTPPPPTHLQILLPSGKTGWIPAASARPLLSDRLCYAKTASGDWKIAAFDQSGE